MTMALTVTVIVVVVVGILSMTRTSQTSIADSELANSFARCEMAVKKIDLEDRATVVDDSPGRLYATWLSQECEVQAGPQYVIRKYTFFENGTFLMLRYHYAEDSCSIATHTVTTRGSVKLLGPSVVVSGATEAKFHVDAVTIVPLNRQVAHKFGHRLNQTCGPQPRWRSYVPQLIYEQPRQRSATRPSWHGPLYNSLQTRSPANKRLGTDCLEAFGIEFDELKLLRVQKKSYGPKTLGGASDRVSRFELLLSSTAPNAHSRWTYKSTSLQSTAMVRADTTSDCPICSGVSRSTEFSPPLLHEAADLPALIGGYWISERCESSEGGIWSRRRFQIHSGDKLWTGRWDYYDDPRCSVFLYAMTAAGSYVQRAGRQRRHDELDVNVPFFDYLRALDVTARSSFFERSATDAFRTTVRSRGPSNSDAANGRSKDDEESIERSRRPFESGGDDEATRRPRRRSLTDNVYRLLRDAQSSAIQSRFAAMLRGHQTPPETSARRASTWSAPSGTTELDLHVAESVLIAGDVTVAARCGADRAKYVPLAVWPRNCVPRAVEAPSTLALRAKLGVDWNGQYTLLLGKRDDSVWEAPLRQCAQIPFHNPVLRAHLRRSVGLRFGLLSSAESMNRISVWHLLSRLLLLCYLCYFVR